jgi:short-subunit dehydrogenase
MPERAALITGGSRGIGFALAQALGEEGYGLTITARKPESLERAAAQLREQGFTVEHIAANLAEEEGVHEVVRRHRERYGRLDVLVNNVGTGAGQPVSEISTRRLDLQLGLNVRTAILCYRESTALLQAAGAEHQRAWAVNVCSRAAVDPQPWLSVYSATKAALLAFSRAMNAELRSSGVRSCAICPGTVATSLTQAHASKSQSDGLVTVDDVAAALRLLLGLSPACELTEVVLESDFDRAWRPPA